MLLLALFSCGQPAPEPEAEPISVRVASFNVSMYRDAAGALADDLTNTELLQGRYAAAILQQVRPDILLLNEVDTDDGTAIARFQENFLSVGQEGQEPLSLPASRKLFTSGNLSRMACTVRRRLPMPLPWMIRTCRISFLRHSSR